jgi:acyl carrier protein
MSDEFIQRLRTVIANSQKLPLDKVTLDSTFEELGIDSMDAVNILFGLESEFDINIPDDEAKDIRTIRQMAEGVEKLVAAKAAGSAPAQ